MVSHVDFICYISCKSSCKLQFASGYIIMCGEYLLDVFYSFFLMSVSSYFFHLFFFFFHHWISIFPLIFTFHLLCFFTVIKFRFYSFDLHIARFLLLTLFGKLSGKLQVKLQIIPCNSCQVAINVEYLLVVFSVPFFNVFVPFFAPYLFFFFFLSLFSIPLSIFLLHSSTFFPLVRVVNFYASLIWFSYFVISLLIC